MADVLVLYHSRTGRTAAMAQGISEALRAEGLKVLCQKVEDTAVEQLLDVDGVIVGSPTYYGTMAAEVKRFLDESITYHTKLDGKVGAAFASAGSTGQETTVVSILQGLLIHGMIVQGDCRGQHYGVTCVGEQDPGAAERYQRFAQRYAALLRRVCRGS
jgi:NAD(P)H dehydrogenase (quinone)